MIRNSHPYEVLKTVIEKKGMFLISNKTLLQYDNKSFDDFMRKNNLKIITGKEFSTIKTK